jgi:uncharacterized protein YkwD
MNQFRNEVLQVHNKLRDLHDTKNLTYDSKLEKTAQLWADHLAEKGLFEHSDQDDFGENLFSRRTTEKLKKSTCHRNFYFCVLTFFEII